MSEGRKPIIGLAIDSDTRSLQALLRYHNGQWQAMLPNMTELASGSYTMDGAQWVDLQAYLTATQILFPPKKPPPATDD